MEKSLQNEYQPGHGAKHPKAFLTGFHTWEEMLSKGPVLLDAVLIPFRDNIISDGLVMPYRIHFGRGAAEDFKEEYMNTKRNQTICFSI